MQMGQITYVTKFQDTTWSKRFVVASDEAGGILLDAFKLIKLLSDSMGPTLTLHIPKLV